MENLVWDIMDVPITAIWYKIIVCINVLVVIIRLLILWGVLVMQPGWDHPVLCSLLS